MSDKGLVKESWSGPDPDVVRDLEESWCVTVSLEGSRVSP